MPRQSVTFTLPQMKWLKEEAHKWGVSTGEIVRRTIDLERRGKLHRELVETTRKAMIPRLFKSTKND